MTTFRADESPTDGHSQHPSVRDRLQRQLGDSYVIARELSGGGSASVFLATEVALDRPVVLKALPSELAAGVDLERFRREITFAARLQHPHLVPLLSAVSSHDVDAPPVLGVRRDGERAASDHVGRPIPWFSMPYVQGQSLRERLLSGRPLPLPEVIRLLREIASALSYAHARGVVHRDIKPENVLLCDGVAMVTDFGVAKALDDASDDSLRTGRRVTTVSMALGTPAYMAPEQVNSAKLVDHKADIYAFGCLAYELLAGAPPLAKPSLRATMAAQVSETPVDIAQQRPDIPAPLAEVIMRCLLKDPQQRPHSASVIVKTIDAILTPPTITGETPAVGAAGARSTPASDVPAASAPRTRGLGDDVSLRAPSDGRPSGSGRSRKLVVIVGAGVVVAAIAIALLRSL